MRPRLLTAAIVLPVLALALVPTSASASRHAAPAVPRLDHVMVVFLENESATATFENAAAAPHLTALRSQGSYVPHYYGAGHASLDNYLAFFGGVEPVTQTKADCLGMAFSSCIYPATVPTLGALLDEAHLGWKIYSEGEDGAPGGHACLHAPVRSLPDPYQGPGTNGYATRHNPAPWFASVLDHGGSEEYCQAHAVDLSRLHGDLAGPSSLPAYSFIEPDTCHDGHDTSAEGGCALGPEGPSAPNGVAAIDAWLPGFVHTVTSSPAWTDKSLLVITFDEGGGADAAGCTACHDGSAGGRIGALFIGAPVKTGFTSAWQGDHYGLLRTLEASWGLPTLKSRAASAAAAATVHDGDPGVTPALDLWQASTATTPTTKPATTKPATTKPATRPQGTAPSVIPPRASLAATGVSVLLAPVAALLLLGSVLALRRARALQRRC